MSSAGTRLLVVVAHPDDESFGCGSVLARASARGVRSVVCCATRGEAGERAPGAGNGDLGATREQELREAARILGVERVVVLGRRDSGMTGAVEPDALVAVPPDRLTGEIRAVIDEVRPDVVVTLDGSDGHRDHLAVRDATLAAARTAEHRPGRTYLWCLARSTMTRWAEHARAAGHPGELGTPDAEITTVVDVGEHLEQRRAAIRAHRSQVSPYDGLPDDLAHAFLATDHLVRVDPPWPGGPPETDLFCSGA